MNRPAALLTVLPELLRPFADYRMLVYAIVLILVMLATNNPTLKSLFSRKKKTDVPLDPDEPGDGDEGKEAV